MNSEKPTILWPTNSPNRIESQRTRIRENETEGESELKSKTHLKNHLVIFGACVYNTYLLKTGRRAKLSSVSECVFFLFFLIERIGAEKSNVY